jgi:hypothetical protein
VVGHVSAKGGERGGRGCNEGPEREGESERKVDRERERQRARDRETESDHVFINGSLNGPLLDFFQNSAQV